MGKGQRIHVVACFSTLTGSRDGQALCMLPQDFAPTLANHGRLLIQNGHRVINFQLQQALEYELATMRMPLSEDYLTTIAH